MNKFFINTLQEIGSSTAVFIGRFQPPHIGHKQILDHISKIHLKGYLFLVKGENSSKDKKKNPFSAVIQEELLSKILPKNIKMKVTSSGFLPKIFEEHKITDKRITLYCGPDRKESYGRINTYLVKENISMVLQEVDFHRSDVCASNVRKALIEDDYEMFKKLMPKELYYSYEKLKKEVA